MNVSLAKLARDRRYSILQFMLMRDEPVLTAWVASHIKNVQRTASQDLTWLAAQDLVLKKKHRGVIKLPRIHFSPHCTWELTSLGRERARQITAQTAVADVTSA